MKLVPYLNFNGDCREAFAFYAKLFEGTLTGTFTYADAPGSDDRITPAWKDKVMNTQLISGDLELMGADAPPQMGDSTPNGFCISIQLDDVARAETIFAALAEDGKVIMPIHETFWADRFGMVTDRFRQPWMVNAGMKSVTA